MESHNIVDCDDGRTQTTGGYRILRNRGADMYHLKAQIPLSHADSFVQSSLEGFKAQQINNVISVDGGRVHREVTERQIWAEGCTNDAGAMYLRFLYYVLVVHTTMPICEGLRP